METTVKESQSGCVQMQTEAHGLLWLLALRDSHEGSTHKTVSQHFQCQILGKRHVGKRPDGTAKKASPMVFPKTIRSLHTHIFCACVSLDSGSKGPSVRDMPFGTNLSAGPMDLEKRLNLARCPFL
jgi:hypothetical protein